MLLAHKGASSKNNYPCSIGSVSSDQILERAPAFRKQLPWYLLREPLLHVNPEYIVSLPLHLYLGINNRIIFDVFTELFGAAKVNDEKLKKVKPSIHQGMVDCRMCTHSMDPKFVDGSKKRFKMS
jgi:hypothetical protein